MNLKIISTVFIISLFTSHSFPQNNPNTGSAVSSFRFHINYNKIILPVKVGGSRQLKIILDSGMGWDGLLIYNPVLKDMLELNNPFSADLGGAGQGNPQPALVADSLSFFIGDAELDNQRIIVLQSDHFKGFPSDGVTGFSLLGHFAVEVNYDDSTITLHDPEKFVADNSWDVVPVYFKNNSIPWLDIKIKIAGEEPLPVSCYIDYASSESIELLIKEDQKFILPEETKEVYLGRGLSGDIYGKKGIVSKIILGSFEIENSEAAFTPAGVRSKQPGADGVIASALLRNFNLIFDYAHKKLYLKPNSTFGRSF